VGAATKKTYRGVQKVTVRQQLKNLPWVRKVTVRFKKLAWAATKKTYRGVQKVSVGSNQKNLPWGSKS